MVVLAKGCLYVYVRLDIFNVCVVRFSMMEEDKVVYLVFSLFRNVCNIWAPPSEFVSSSIPS